MDFENEGYVGTAIIYNQEQAIPSGNSPSEEPLWNTFEGSQGLYFIASGASNTTTPNNDWMISPEFSLNGISNPILSFVANFERPSTHLLRMAPLDMKLCQIFFF